MNKIHSFSIMYITYNNSTIATVQQITIYSQSRVVNTFIKPGIRKPLVRKKKTTTHKILRCPYGLSKSKLSREEHNRNGGDCRTHSTQLNDDLEQEWCEKRPDVPTALLFKSSYYGSCQLSEFPRDFHFWLRYLRMKPETPRCHRRGGWTKE